MFSEETHIKLGLHRKQIYMFISVFWINIVLRYGTLQYCAITQSITSRIFTTVDSHIFKLYTDRTSRNFIICCADVMFDTFLTSVII
jgi:hypothetical protein